MACITPGIQKNRVKNIFNINAPILPVVRMATGGSKKHKKYRMVVVLMFNYCLDHTPFNLLLLYFLANIGWQLIAKKQGFKFGSIVRVHFAAQYQP